MTFDTFYSLGLGQTSNGLNMGVRLSALVQCVKKFNCIIDLVLYLGSVSQYCIGATPISELRTDLLSERVHTTISRRDIGVSLEIGAQVKTEPTNSSLSGLGEN